MSTLQKVLVIGLLVMHVAQVQAQVPLDGPLAPDQALKSFQVEAGLKLELVAAEPLVVSPCAVAWDERGRMFVAENRGYPVGPKEGEPPQGRIAQLIDKDGDGRMDERIDFATELSFPNGLMPWRGGLIVTCSPDVLFLKDTDGDGKADEKKVLLTGFSTKGSTQLRVSHPLLALDGWVYLTSGLTGGEVVSPLKPDQAPVKVGRTDIRFKPDTGETEPCDGGAQFGQTFDDFGRRFICYNRVQVQHVVLESKYLKRNPHLAFAETVENCPAEMADEPLKGHGKAAKIFPISSNVTTADSHAGTFTAACGITYVRGAMFPFEDMFFSCDPTGNLVHADRCVPHGATFRAHSSFPGREVLASTDNWFRPVFVANSPEGALYVCDMYRKTIEHPDYLPVEVRKHTDFEGGKTMGRIYRLVVGYPPDDDDAELRKKNNDQLRQALYEHLRMKSDVEWSTQMTDWSYSAVRDREGQWLFNTNLRLVIEGRCKPDLEALRNRFVNNHNQSQMEKLLSFCTLRHHGVLTETDFERALLGRGALVSEMALQTVEPWLAKSTTLQRSVLAMWDAPQPRSQMQVALMAGSIPLDEAITALAGIGLNNASDRWIRAAVLSSLSGREDAFLGELMKQATSTRASKPASANDVSKNLDYEVANRFARSLPDDGGSNLFYDFGRLLGASKTLADARPLILKITTKWTNPKFEHQVPLLTGLVDGLRARGFAKPGQSVLETLLADIPDADRRELSQSLEPIADAAALKAEDADAPAEIRRRAIDFLAHAKSSKALSFLTKLVSAQQPEPVQSSAIKALIGLPDEQVAETLLTRERFQSYPPRMREEIIGMLSSTPRHVPGLLTAIESGTVPPAAIDTLRRRQLSQHKDPAVKERATKIFGAGPSGDRAKVYEEHKSVLTLTPNAENGRQVFKRACTSCHRLDREGTQVGPDLFGIRNQPKEAILLHILIPEHEITPGFAAYIVTTKEGRVLTGLISAETATSITLKQALGKEETILRQDIEELSSSNLSLMPQGVEKTVNKQEFADLLSYLKGEK